MRANPCQGRNCPHGCGEWSEASRDNVFTAYWGLGDSERQRDWITGHVKKSVKSRKTTASDRSHRNFTFRYYLNQKQVCKRFFLATLDIGERLVYRTINNGSNGSSKKDQRGKHAPANRTSERQMQFVKRHIESLPAVPSHYCRKTSNLLYLEQDLRNVSNVYRLYVEEAKRCHVEPVKLQTYRREFRKYDLAFHKPKKDKCSKCEANKNTPDAQKTDEHRGDMTQHFAEKEATYKECSADPIKAKDDEPHFKCASFDLEKVLNTPSGQSMLFYYSRKYAVYNLTVYESGTRRGYCNLWGEADAQRGANEVGTCIYKWLEKVSSESGGDVPTHVVMYCDCCGGQNRNRFIVAMLVYAARKLRNIGTLELKFLLTGHTYMQVDSMHAAIEYEARSRTVEAPRDWITVMRNARKNPSPYVVEWLEHTDFMNWKTVESQLSLKNARDETDGCKVRWSAIRQIKLDKNAPESIFVKYSFVDQTEHVISIAPRKTRNSQQAATPPLELESAYTERRPISAAKYRDLMTLCRKRAIHPRYAEQYISLPHNDTTRDCLAQPDVMDESEDDAE